ncbi:MAG TPA: DUF1579 family protein [Candidatus Acidoferrales bacterium]|nr:DUF1579 family protein [Candidatus Acidoferrales bacterium]
MVHQKQWLLCGCVSAMLVLPAPALAQGSAQNRQQTAAPARANSTQAGAPQAALAKLAGEYDRIIKFVGQTGAMVAPSSGACKISVVLGGRFILEESTDTVFGHAVEGLRIYGYNNATQQYEMARMYTMSTAITMMKGTSSDGGKTIDYTGETETSGTGAAPMHAQLRQIDDDHFVVTLSTTGPDGKETPFQETDYSRKK